MDADAYHDQLSALLPPGLPWPRAPETRLQRLLAAWADTLVRIDARGDALLEEADPRTAAELLDEWEHAYGLPDRCYDDITSTPARRAALLARILDRGGQRPADYLAIAAALGVQAELHEFRPHTVESDVNVPLWDITWAYAWEVRIPDGAPGTFACLLRRRKPAHTTLIVTVEV